ncbi:MAG: T9SS type A sorting domain-containing protein [Candidatus Eisenbacteria bacterium]
MTHRIRPAAAHVSGLGMLALLTSIAAAQDTATWTGAGGDLLYSNPANWDVGAVPVNGGTSYSVVIPGSPSVLFDLGAAASIDALDLAKTATLDVDSGRTLSVLGVADIKGGVSADGVGTKFTASSPSSLLGAKGSLVASGGALLIHGATSYNHNDNSAPTNWTVLSADGAGTILDVSALTTYTDNRNLGGQGVRTLVASNGGTLDLSSLQTIVGGVFDDTVALEQRSGGSLLLPNLTSVTGLHRFTADPGETLSLPALTAVSRMVLDLGTGSSFVAPSLVTVNASDVHVTPDATATTGSLTNIDGSRISVSGGASFWPVSATSYNYTGDNLPNAATLFAADGAGSVLDLSSLQTFQDDRNFGGSPVRNIVATNGGTVDLSGVNSVVGGTFDDIVSLDFTSTGSLLLGNLSTVSGRTRFKLDPGVSVTFPLLTSVSETFFDLGAGASFVAPSLTSYQASQIDLDPSWSLTTGGITNIDGSRISVSGGFDYADIVATEYHYVGPGIPSSAEVFTADGAGSVLDLSSLDLLSDDRNLGGAAVRTITATNGGTVDLSNLTTSVGGVFDDMLSYDFTATGSLLMGHLTSTTGRTRLSLEPGVSVTLPNLVSMDEAFFDLDPTSTLDLPVLTTLTSSELAVDTTLPLSTAPLSEVDGSRFFISGGIDYTSIVDTQYTYTGTGIPSAGTIMSADGASSRLDLTSVTEWIDDRNLGGAAVRSLTATNGGTLDLSNLTSVVGGVIDDILSFDFEAGSSLLIGNLTTVTGRTRFTLPAGVSVSLPLLTSVSEGFFDLDPASNFDAPNLVSITATDLALEPSVPLTTGSLTSIDGSRIAVSGGLVYSDVVAETYSYVGPNLPSSTTYLSATGAGSVLDLSSLVTFDDDRNLGGQAVRTVSATDGGLIDLSSVKTVLGGVLDDTVLFETTTGGSIDLRMLGGITRSGGVSGNVAFHSVDAGSAIHVGNLALVEDDGTLLLENGGALHVGEGFVFDHTTEADVTMEEGRIVFDAGDYPGRAVIEIGSPDLGAGGLTAGSFGVGQFVLGSASETVEVELVDWKDNGNRNGGPEAPYLFGIGSEDGLVIENGSTLIIAPDMNVYAVISGVSTNLHDLFGAGETEVPFGGGFIRVEEPTSGIGDDVDGNVHGTPGTPTETSVAAFPNPTHGASEIRLGLAESGATDVALFDVQGRLIRNLLRSEVLNAGSHLLQWDGRDERGVDVAGGIYFVRMQSTQGDRMERIVVTR